MRVKTSDAFSSQGMSTPEPVHDRLRAPCGHIHAQRERREAREMADAFGDVLVKRNGVAETRTARMRRGGEKADVRRMPAIDVRMRDAAENGEIIAMLLEDLKVGREGVIASGFLREEIAPGAGRGCCRCRASGAARRLS